MASQRSDQASNERRIKKVEANLVDALNQLSVLQVEKESFDREMRDRDTKLLTKNNELEDLKEQLEESERMRNLLARELEELGSNRDDTGKSLMGLEQANYQLDQRLKEAKQQIEELEDEISSVTMDKQRAEVVIFIIDKGLPCS